MKIDADLTNAIFRQVKEQVRIALLDNTPIAAAAVSCLIDCGETAKLADELRHFLYDEGHFAASIRQGFGIQQALAPLLCDARFAPSASVRNRFLQAALDRAFITMPPPVLVVRTLAQASAGEEAVAVSFGGARQIAFQAQPDRTIRLAAQEACEIWFDHAAVQNQPIDPELIQAYVSLDRVRAQEWIARELVIRMTQDGACQGALMDAFRVLNPSGPGWPSTDISPAPGGLYLDPDFDRPGPMLAGWAYIATASLTRTVSDRRPLDFPMLLELGTVDSRAAAYVRWWALSVQPADHMSLDARHVLALAQYDPQLMIKLVASIFEKALQPSSLRILDFGGWSALQSVDARCAQGWWDRFEAAHLLPYANKRAAPSCASKLPQAELDIVL